MNRLTSALARLLLRSGKSIREGGDTPQSPSDRRKLSLSDAGIHYIDYRGREHSIGWQDISYVWWSEPDYGYLGGMPYWTVTGHGTSIDIDDESIGKGSSELPQWLSKKLPGFDVEVVEKAFKRGYFKTEKPEQLKCWLRPTANSQ